MADVKWIKLSTSMFDDEKIRLIESMPEADSILVIWIKLLSQAGKVNASGYIFLAENIPYTDEMLATLFNRPLGVVRMALKVFQQFGMIEIDEQQYISIANWDKHQNTEGLDKIREQNRLRKQRERDKKRLELPKKDEMSRNMSRDSHVTVTHGHATDIDIDKDKEIDSSGDAPHLELFNHYQSKGIMKHVKMTDAMKRAARSRLKDYTLEQLKRVIDNYATVYHGGQYWFSYKYSFADLMREKDVLKFLDDAEPLANFAVNKGYSTDQTSHVTQAQHKPYVHNIHAGED